MGRLVSLLLLYLPARLLTRLRGLLDGLLAAGCLLAFGVARLGLVAWGWLLGVGLFWVVGFVWLVGDGCLGSAGLKYMHIIQNMVSVEFINLIAEEIKK